jgi:hypothetical protein
VLNRANKADKLEAKIEKLQLRIKELETMKTQTITEVKEVEVVKEVPVEVIKEVEVVKEVSTPLAINSDLQELIKNEIALQVKEALKGVKSEVKVEVKPEVKEDVKPTAAKTDDTDWEGMSNEDVWKTKKQGASTEKIRRSFVAVGFYNGEVANGEDLPKIAITNQVLRDLSRCNGQLVADWMRDHADEIISHNEGFGVFTKSGQLESYANRQIGISTVKTVLEVVNNRFLDGQALNKK